MTKSINEPNTPLDTTNTPPSINEPPVPPKPEVPPAPEHHDDDNIKHLPRKK